MAQSSTMGMFGAKDFGSSHENCSGSYFDAGYSWGRYFDVCFRMYMELICLKIPHCNPPRKGGIWHKFRYRELPNFRILGLEFSIFSKK